MIVTVLFGRANPVCGNNQSPVRITPWITGFPCRPWDPITREHVINSEGGFCFCFQQMKWCSILYGGIQIQGTC